MTIQNQQGPSPEGAEKITAPDTLQEGFENAPPTTAERADFDQSRAEVRESFKTPTETATRPKTTSNVESMPLWKRTPARIGAAAVTVAVGATLLVNSFLPHGDGNTKPALPDEGEQPVATAPAVPGQPENTAIPTETVRSIEQTQEQLAQQFIIPASTPVDKVPQLFTEKFTLLQNAGANPVDVPAQNWQSDDPYFQELANKETAAASSALLKEGEPAFVNQFLPVNLWAYGKTSFEKKVYPDTESTPYAFEGQLVGTPTIVDNGNGTYEFTMNIRMKDNGDENSMQNVAREQGDSDGVYDAIGEYHVTGEISGDRWVFSNLTSTTVSENAH